MNNSTKGFTLVEMTVIAPIVILLIGAFIALIINLTGDALSSHSADRLSYDLQESLDRIETDVKLSLGFLATNSISAATTGQGYNDSPTTGSTVDFTNVNNPSGSPASLIIEGFATTKAPAQDSNSIIFLANQPNSCADPGTYIANTPMPINIVYFVDSSNTLWRRVVMNTNFNNSATYCGSIPPWNLPSCKPGYVAASRPHCKTNDEKLLTGVNPADFEFNYYASAGATAANPNAKNPSVTIANRNLALKETLTTQVKITAKKTVAGKDISQTGTLRATRMQVGAQ